MRPKHVQTVQIRVELGVMAIKWHATPPDSRTGASPSDAV